MTLPKPERWCPNCREYVLAVDGGDCIWCDTATEPTGPSPPRRRYTGKKRGRPKGKYRRMTDDQVRAAHALYVKRELSCYQLGELLWKRFGYSSARSCGMALYAAFRSLGLPRRSQRYVTIKRNLKHGRKRRDITSEDDVAYRHWLAEQRGWDRVSRPGNPTCKAVKRQPPGKGKRCRRPAMDGSDFCQSHDPARELARQAHLARVRQRQPPRDTVPFEPFARWAEQLHADLGGSLDALAARLGCSKSTAHNILRQRGTVNGKRGPKTDIGRHVVERYLEHAGGPALEDLYQPQPQEAAA